MLLCVDIGNTNIKFGIFDGTRLHSKFSIESKGDPFADALRSSLGPYEDMPVSDAIVCSVVPGLNDPISALIRSVFGVDAVVVSNDLDLGLKIDYQPLADAGTDRIVDCFAAAAIYGAPCVVCSFGTALTIDVVDSELRLRGGLIAPGMAMMSKALHQNTSKLPEVPIDKPDAVIQTTTTACIQSGIVFGYFGLVAELITRVKNEIGDNPKVIATGGAAVFVMENVDLIDTFDEDLLLNGLRLIHERFITV